MTARQIRAEDISDEADTACDAERFWPAPLIQLNPNFEVGGYVGRLRGPACATG